MLKDVSGEAKIQSLVRVLDEDHDGNINLEELGEVREREGANNNCRSHLSTTDIIISTDPPII